MTRGPEQLLAIPTTANSLYTPLPPGEILVVAYVRYLTAAATSPAGLPAGSRAEIGPFNIQPLTLTQPAQGRRLMQGN